MDKRKKYILMIDTETCNAIVTDDGLDLSQSLVYDIGCAIVDKKGNVYETASFVIADIFLGMQDVMTSAYYADKIPQYWDDLKSRKRIMVTFYNARRLILEMMARYNCTTVCAHNAGFDYRSLNNTQRWVTKSKYRYFFPYKCVWWDTLKMARQIYKNRPSYEMFCSENNYKTKHKTPQNRLTAEILHRFLTGDNDFIESHTGLEDVLIEAQILAQCLRQHKKMTKELWG